MKSYDVLTKKEIEILAKIRTTKKQAGKIKRRNKALLKKVEEWLVDPHHIDGQSRFKVDERGAFDEKYSRRFGCPHCINSDHYCTFCSWVVLRKEVEDGVSRCLVATFGGLTLRKMHGQRICELNYMMNNEFVKLHIDPSYPADRIVKELLNVQRFLQGHIQWADIVLSKNGEE